MSWEKGRWFFEDERAMLGWYVDRCGWRYGYGSMIVLAAHAEPAQCISKKGGHVENKSGPDGP